MNNQIKPSVRVYSIIKNCQAAMKRVRKGETDLDRPEEYGYNHTSEYLQSIYTRIAREIENHWYTYLDLKIYCVHQLAWLESIDVVKINEKTVKLISDKYKQEELEKSKNILVEVSKNIIFNSLEDFFQLNKDGFTTIITLIENEYISPIFWIKYDKFFKISTQNFEESEYHKRIRKGLKIIKNELLKGV